MSHSPDLSHTLDDLRAQFIERTWHVACFAAAVIGPLVVLRNYFLNAHPLRPLPLLLLTVLAILGYTQRKLLPPRLYRDLPPAFMILAGLAGLLASGLQGIGVMGLVFGHLSMTVTHRRRHGLIALAVSMLAATVIAVLYVNGVLKPAFSLAFASNAYLWGGLLVVTLLLSIFLATAIGHYRDSITTLLAEVERQRDQIATLANHDTLTGLPLLRLVRDRLAVACAMAEREQHLVAVLFIDLDGFKAVNDNYGHDAGDLVLREVARRLLHTLRASDTAARIGGDEFLVILPDVTDAGAASVTAAKLVESLTEPIDIGIAQAQIGASIGIAIFPEHGADGEALMRRADAAMYAVKRSGKNNFALAGA